MHHLIFIPRDHVSGLTPAEQLAAVGLADHAADALTVPCEGPDGSGTLYGWRKHGAGKLHYNADEQTWIPAAQNGELPAKRYWVGVWNESPPTEGDLRRPGVLYGDDVELGDGSKWHVPAPHFLPHDLMLQADGTLKHEPKQRYQDVCLEATRWRARLFGQERVVVAYEELWAFALRCLSLNYRIPAEAASHLRLIDTENVKSVLHTALRSPLDEVA